MKPKVTAPFLKTGYRKAEMLLAVSLGLVVSVNMRDITRTERNLSAEELKERLQRLLNRQGEEKSRSKHIWKGRSKAKNEKENIS